MPSKRIQPWIFPAVVLLVCVIAPLAWADLMAVEDFKDAALGPLAKVSSGSGWATGWWVQNDSTDVPGYNVANTSPMKFADLIVTDAYAVGGDQYKGCGRPLDVNGAFANFKAADGKIGKSGATLWISCLIRKDADNDDDARIGLSPDSNAWLDAPCNVRAGYFGGASNRDGKRLWSLKIGGDVKTSDVEVKVGEAALLVLRIDFTDGGDNVSLYVNPGNLGAEAPPTPSIVAPNTSAHFLCLNYFAGNSAGNSSLGDIRIGETFGDVTPTPVNPNGK